MHALPSRAGLGLADTNFADRCVDNRDGTVTDNVASLMWHREAMGKYDWD